MMGVLLQCVVHSCLPVYLPNQSIPRLGNISDPKQVGTDGQTIEGRMQTLCAKAAVDIERCANTCDVYVK